MRKWLFILLGVFIILSGCAPSGGGGSDDDDGPTVLVNPSGKAEDGPCGLLSTVSAISVDANWLQTGFIPGEMKNIDGTYSIMGTVAGPYMATYFQGTCYNHTLDTNVDNIVMKMFQPTTATMHNMNRGTTLRAFVAEELFKDSGSSTYQDAPASFVLAKSMIYDFLGFPNATANFYEMSVVGDTTADAYLLLFESAIGTHGSGPDQNDYIGILGNAVLDGSTTVRDELRATIAGLSIKQIVNNMNNWLLDRGLPGSAAPVWTLPIVPDYYADLMTRTPTILEEQNMGVTSSCSFDTGGYNKFAYPIRFTNATLAKYIAFKHMTGNLSIYTKRDTQCEVTGTFFDCPGEKVVDIEELREILLPSTSSAVYNGSLEGTVLQNEADYFLVQTKDEAFTPTRVCSNGDTLPFGSILALPVGVDDWKYAIGPGNTSSFYSRAVAKELTN